MDNQNNKNNKNNKQGISFILLVTVITSILVIALFQFQGMTSAKEITYNKFLKMVDDGEVRKVQIQSDKIMIVTKKDKDSGVAQEYYTGVVNDDDLTKRLEKAGVEFKQEIPDTTSAVAMNVILTFLPIAFFVGMIIWMTKRMSKGGGMMGIGKSNAKMYVEKQTGVTFKDVAGQDEAKESLQEVVDFLHNPKKYSDIGAKLPKGALLVGPPGTGKTSIAKSIAHAIGSEFERISLGGVRDESEIVGHRKTYVGSMPGRIIHGMQTCGCMNPVFLLDEIDKMASDFRGDPASALLEVLDPEQNNSFSDHFIEFPFDLSHVFWIVTANAVDTIPPALLDRLEIIQLSSYTDEEKVKIAQLHLLPKELKLNGLEKYKVSVSEKAIRRVIHDYTREAGVRNLERKLAGICRKVAFKIVKGKSKGAQVTEKNLEKYLGPVIYLDDDISLKSSVGVANGLAWTSVGGELLKVEVLAFKGKGNLTLTGQLGDVMKESAQAGYTYIRSRAEALGIAANFGETMDIHIHLPEGAVPKDGPSAGVTMVTAMVSALTDKKVKGKLAMTGEISLSGKVWPVGGIKEKMLAAYRYGVKTVLLPKRNMQDLDELPENIRKEMQFIPVEHLDDVLKLALEDKNE
mgnify:CR=1 FL=1